MGSESRRRAILEIVRTDRTFERAEQGGRQIQVGKCLHCKARLSAGADGMPLGRATSEHILPRAHGGTGEPANLALACDRCNHEKARRHDHRPRDDVRRIEVTAKLQRIRLDRWRHPPGVMEPSAAHGPRCAAAAAAGRRSSFVSRKRSERE